MILDAFPFSKSENVGPSNLAQRALRAVVNLLEKKLGVSVAYDLQNIPYGRGDLMEEWRFAGLLKEKGIIHSFSQIPRLPDEPPMKTWAAICADPTSHLVAGASPESDRQALRATLAEALERYIWFTERDYFSDPIRATVEQIGKRRPFVAPERFIGFSSEQRENRPKRELRSGALYLWIKGTSLVTERPTYVPAQLVSGVERVRFQNGSEEPSIRHGNTIGLATWPTQAGARLAGALETIEREAFMIAWLNQLTLPRIDLDSAGEKDETLKKFIASCRQYRLKPHAVQLLTDAPTHAVCAIIEDESDVEPRFTVGLKAHRSLSFAIQKAMTEALRARQGYRHYIANGNRWDPKIPVEDVGHRDRLYYWGLPEHAKKLEFLIAGKEQMVPGQEWDNDTPEQQLQRVIAWCRSKGFECVAVSLGNSRRNPTSLFIEMVLIPELQPTYLLEKYRAFGGNRWREIPKQFGYPVREKPFSDTPHPFS
jgi:ribosomal protein S12 methylthiotransferase accessory factor